MPAAASAVSSTPVAAKESSAPLPVAAPYDADLDDAEIVQAEVQKMLAGDEFNEKIIISAGDYARSLVTAELIAALSSKSIMRREAAQNAFVSYGYLDQVGRNLHDARTSAQRVAAARILALLKSLAATPLLLQALKDKSPEVRRAAVEALAEISDPAAVPALEATRDREKRRDMPKQLINRAIAACTAGKPAPATLASLDASITDNFDFEESISEVTKVESRSDVNESVKPVEEETAQHIEEAAQQVAPLQVRSEKENTTASVISLTPVPVEIVAEEVAETTSLPEEAGTVITPLPVQPEETAPFAEIAKIEDERTIEQQAVHVEEIRDREKIGDQRTVKQTTETSSGAEVETTPFELALSPAVPESPAFDVSAPTDVVAASDVSIPPATEDEWFDLNIQDGGAAAFEERKLRHNTLRQSNSTPMMRSDSLPTAARPLLHRLTKNLILWGWLR
jgi:hypothetical protein